MFVASRLQSADTSVISRTADGTHYVLSGPALAHRSTTSADHDANSRPNGDTSGRISGGGSATSSESGTGISASKGLVVCVHGISGFHLVFEGLAKFLNDAGTVQLYNARS